jgi:hypothetical protein
VFKTFLTAGFTLLLANSCTQISTRLSPPPSIKTSITESKVLFDGTSLEQFNYIDGDIWAIQEDGTVKGETTAEKKIKKNTFLISKDQDIADFEATLSYKLTTENNSGVIYRAEQIEDPSLFRVKGYQAEGENDMLKGGFMYDEARRAWIANPGEYVIVRSKSDKQIVGQVNDHSTLIENKFLNDKEWNFYRIVARGNHFMHYINGHLAMELIDQDPTDSSRTGSFCLQIHAGKPMTVFFKDVKVAKYTNRFAKARVLFMASLRGWDSVNTNSLVTKFTSPNERGLKARGYDVKKQLDSTVAVITKNGWMARKLPAANGLVRLHVKGDANISIGDQTFAIPYVENSADNFTHVEFLLKDGKVDFSINNKTIETRSVIGQDLKISGGPVSVRNVIFLPFEK